ncbi:MAG TPA: GNAT family N-acetyltransferase [Streptosporangiales bacterium]
MRCELTHDARAFWPDVRAFLAADPVVHNVLATNIEARSRGALADEGTPTFASVRDDDGRIVGVAMHTPPFNAYLSRMPVPAVAEVARALRSAGVELPGVTSTTAEARAFAELWCADGGGYEVGMSQRIHVLGELVPPTGVAGRPRVAGASDRDLLVAWTLAFGAETGVPGSADAMRRAVNARLAEGLLHVWCRGDEVVSYAGRNTPNAGVVRVGPVYTPPEQRGNGYASALVAAVSRVARDGAGVRDVCLYTDLANPTSNKIYAQVGYRPLCDVTAYSFRG